MEAAYFTDAMFAEQASSGTILVSPTGRYAFTVLRRGDLTCDCTVDELLLFGADDLLGSFRANARPIEPLRTAIIHAASSTLVPTLSPRWIGDGPSIAFLGVAEDGTQQLMIWDDQGAAPRPATNAAGSILAFDVHPHTVIYYGNTQRSRISELTTYPAMYLDISQFGSSYGGDVSGIPLAIFSRSGEQTSQVLPSQRWYYPSTTVSLSPDGARALVVYADETGSSTIEHSGSGNSTERLISPNHNEATRSNYYLIDVENGTRRRLFDQPATAANSPVPRALWFSNSRRAIVVRARWTRSGTPNSSELVNLDLATRTERLIAALPPDQLVTALQWVDHDRAFVATTTSGAFRYSFLRGVWSVSAVDNAQSTALANGVRVFVAQDMNTPPVLRAAYGDQQRNLTNLPINEPTRNAVELFEWTDANGRRYQGALTRAPNVRRAPLVIQPYLFEPAAFRPGGSVSTAFSAQALASQGIHVLQFRPIVTTGESGAVFVRTVDSAVDALAASGDIDPHRVGLVGFSFTGYLTKYALTHPGTTHFAAAVDADGNDHGYIQSLMYATISPWSAGAITEFNADHGGDIWRDPQAWMRESPGFNVHRVQTPLLMTVSGYGKRGADFSQSLEMYAGLILNGRSVELLYFPDGEHVLLRPREVLASQEATLDWMTFWLLGREDGDPEKTGMYARWRGMRRNQCETLSEVIDPWYCDR